MTEYVTTLELMTPKTLRAFVTYLEVEAEELGRQLDETMDVLREVQDYVAGMEPPMPDPAATDWPADL